MSNKWEFEDEYLQLSSEYRKAKKEGNSSVIQRVKPRLDELNRIMWQSMVNGFPELTPYSSLVEALEQLCLKKNLPFPDLNDRERNFTGKGDWRETGRFIFDVGNRNRSIQIFPMESRGYIDIEVYEGKFCYKGQTSSVMESAIVLSKWYMQGCSIKELHQQFSWMPDEPLKLSGPRVTYK